MSAPDRVATRFGALEVARAVLTRPRLWPAALGLVPTRWWRRWPPLPLPDPAYTAFRMETMYGPGGRLDAEDLVRYLEWCARMRSAAR